MKALYLTVAIFSLFSASVSAPLADTTAATLKLECKNWSGTSDVHKNFSFSFSIAEVTAADPGADTKDFVRTGGGCQIDNPTTGHRVIITTSRPNGVDGWYCEAGEQNGTDTRFKITAHVVGCRIDAKK